MVVAPRAVPLLVVTDSQAFLKVTGGTPSDIPMASFSIPFARHKGDLTDVVRGVTTIADLRPGAVPSALEWYRRRHERARPGSLAS